MNTQRQSLQKQKEIIKKMKASSGQHKGGAANDNKAKFLESQMEKLQIIIDKQQAGTTKAKKDLQQSKSENIALQNKVNELERKVGKK